MTHYDFDAAGRKIAETNAKLEIIRYTNNAAGDLLSLTDGKNQTTRWNYDQYGHVTNQVDQAGTEIFRYKYDADNRLTNRWSMANSNTYYTYDPVGNLTFVNYSASPDVTFQYDALSRVTNMVDAVGTTKYTYTIGGQLWTEDGPFANDTVTNIFSSRLRVEMDLQQPTGMWTNQFGYDSAKRLTGVTSPAGAFTYTLGATAPASPLIKTLLLPNTSYITNIYDGNARLLGTWLKKNDNTTLDFATYGYNLGNLRIGFTNSIIGSHGYSYDPNGQLIGVISSVRYNYGYDAAWNVTSFTNALGADSFSMDGRNQITSDGVYGIGYYYDANGDLIESYNSGYHYDAECRLVSVVSGDGDTFEYPPVQSDVRTDFVYDGLGRLRKQIYYGAVECDEFEGYCWQVAGETHYIYDGMRVIQERNVNDVPTVSYTRGNDLSGTMEGAGGIGGLLARSYAYQSGSGAFASHHYYFADGNGNISYLETTSQSLGALYSYDPFGNQEYGIGVMANANKYRFSSKEIVAENSYEFPIYYFGYRFYAPSLQRWLNRDPLEEPGFEAFLGGGFFPGSAGQNLYAFVRNNPISRADALGLCDIKIRCGSVKRAGVTLGVHCGVVAPNGVEYGLGGGDQSSGSSGTAHPYPSGPNPSPGPVNPPAGDKDYPVSCPCKSCDDVQNSIQDYHDNVTPPSYRATGPNSDTYAHNMLDAAGCGVNPIPREPLNIFRGPGTPPIILPLPPTTTPPGTVAW